MAFPPIGESLLVESFYLEELMKNLFLLLSTAFMISQAQAKGLEVGVYRGYTAQLGLPCYLEVKKVVTDKEKIKRYFRRTLRNGARYGSYSEKDLPEMVAFVTNSLSPRVKMLEFNNYSNHPELNDFSGRGNDFPIISWLLDLTADDNNHVVSFEFQAALPAPRTIRCVHMKLDEE